MTYLLKDNDQSFIACFEERPNQFTLLVTNWTEFFIENLTADEIHTRFDNENEGMRVKDTGKVIRTLKGNPGRLKEGNPDNCTITRIDNDEANGSVPEALRISLSFPFIVKSNVSHPMNFYFKVDKCDKSEIGKFFATSLMKLVIENSLLLEKLRKAVEAKDQEIDDYKKNGATLIRGKTGIIQIVCTSN